MLPSSLHHGFHILHWFTGCWGHQDWNSGWGICAWGLRMAKPPTIYAWKGIQECGKDVGVIKRCISIYVSSYVYDLISICVYIYMYICIYVYMYIFILLHRRNKYVRIGRESVGFQEKTTEPTNVPWKSMFGRYISYWNSPSWKNTLQFSGVYLSYWFCLPMWNPAIPLYHHYFSNLLSKTHTQKMLQSQFFAVLLVWISSLLVVVVLR